MRTTELSFELDREFGGGDQMLAYIFEWPSKGNDTDEESADFGDEFYELPDQEEAAGGNW